MKKNLSIFILTITISIGVQAQEDIRIGALVGYGSEIESFGVGVNAEFPVMKNLTVSPSFVFYLPKDDDFIKTNVFEFNANANYYFLTTDALGVYGLAGVNYSHVKTDIDFGILGDGSTSEGKVGLNIGAGTNFNLGGRILPFAEVKYILSDFDQFVIAAGVKFNL
ncbi:outer membrane protein [Moheibacter lacus]|uniref:Outer membrane beta-barrel protein n=1 Tax=Moheibacter lacus TaxID=2745851 RepID=A0A838ZTW0_9FLAO|nr:outer membrane beta-barrel protein [Moheibacter lacus]MBA5630402.1 outer membrane beta-barrel protein [Moheibacter lacus]